MAVKPLTKWTCDTCGESVDVNTGMLEWIEGSDIARPRARDFHIIHNEGRCRQDKDQDGYKDVHLTSVVGPEGLQYLIDIFSRHGNASLADPTEYATIMRRLQVLYFEEARQHFAEHAEEYGMNSDDLEAQPITTFKAIAEQH